MTSEESKALPATIYCSFCGKSQHDVGLIVAGNNAFICSHCIAECLQILSDKARQLTELLTIKEKKNG